MFLNKVDHIIEIVIIDNIFEYNGVNIYNELLFKKSACLYNLNKLHKAEKVLKALINLDKNNVTARELFTLCKRWQLTSNQQIVKAVSMICILLAMLVAFAQLFIIKPFYQDAERLSSYILYGLLSLSIILLVGNEIVFRFKIHKEIGYKFQFKKKISNINQWYLNLTGGKINKNGDPF